MNTTTKTALVGLLSFTLAAPVFAQTVDATAGVSGSANVGGTSVGVKAQATVEARISKGKERADQEIDRRVNMLNQLNTRVQGMARVSSTEKASISSEVSTEVSTLTSLKAKIDADTDIATLKVDIQSITKSYRIFMLIIPQGRIEVAADRIKTVGSTATTFAGKLQTRIASAQAAGKDVTTLSASLSDMNAKIADASVQADAAVSLVASLTPDNGDQTKMNANNQALKDARAKIKLAMDDLQAARKDATSIMQGLKSMNASATSSTNVQTQ